MKRSDFSPLSLILYGGAIYVLFKYVIPALRLPSQIPQAFTSTQGAITDWLSNTFPTAANAAQAIPGAKIFLPDGTVISADSIQGQGGYTASDGSIRIQFFYGGGAYNVPATPDSNGNYTARAGVGG